MEKDFYQITNYVHRIVSEHIKPGDRCVDATMGNGNDTLFLCQQVGEAGKVFAFDVQQQALDRTKDRLERDLPYHNYELYLDSHSNIKKYIAEESISCILFNLGYLPGADHALSTKAETTLTALEQSLPLLEKGGILSVCIYSGGDSGFEERDRVLSYIKALDPKKYLVLLTEFYNRPHNPPIPAFVIRM